MGQRRAVANAVAIVLSSSIFFLKPAAALEYSYALGYGAEHSDNIRLTPNNEVGDWIQVLNASINLSQLDPELETRTQARVAYRDYHRNTFADDTTVGLNGILLWKPLPEAFQWVVEEVFTQTAVNAAAADTPANRENTNVLATGPDLFWKLSPVHTLQFSARYTDNSFDATRNTVGAVDADNTRRSGNVKWSYRPSETMTLSLGYLREAVQFKDSGQGANLDFRRSETVVELTNKLARNTLTVDLGVTRIDRDGQRPVDGTLARLAWQRELTSESAFTLGFSRSLSDTGTELLTTADPKAPPTTTTAVASPDIFVSKQLNATYALHSGNDAFSLTVFRAKREFELATVNDDDVKGANLNYTHQFSQTFSSSFAGQYAKTSFSGLARENEDRSVVLGLQYNFTRTLAGNTGISQRWRTSTEAGAEFVEHRLVIGLTYGSLPVHR